MLYGEKILVSVDGKPGEPGYQYYGHRDRTAPFGRVGENGRSSCAATPGTSAGSIALELTASSAEEFGVHAEGVGAWAGTRWEVSTDKTLFLSARGGDGGAGGQGEDGQDGGKGPRGSDATKHRDATSGGPGERGGDGGYGTDGADGGNGGSVFVRVKEQDAHLLLAVDWDIDGGKGGNSGAHGNPGDGGEGGDGGVGCTWEEFDGYYYACCGGGHCTCGSHNRKSRYRTRTRPPGNKGNQGAPGSRPPTYLRGGAGGVRGAAHIHVSNLNGTEATYPSRYHLVVVGFEVHDENGDGVNEPGEHVLVNRIYVQNTGGMPSPTQCQVPVLIHGSMWLDPIQEPVYIPSGIQPGETVEVPGVLRAFIQQERSRRQMGATFSATDDIKLIGIMPGINRVLPDFCGATTIKIGYPLELEAPRYLNSVERGSNVTFSWMLRNVSTKPYGAKGILGRGAGTCLSENPGTQIFSFEAGESRGLDLLDTLDPGTAVTIRQTFKVSEQAEPYSTGALTLELVLSEPGNNQGLFSPLQSAHFPMRSVMHYPLEMQISSKYAYNPAADYLLVVNADTKREVIHQICGLVADMGMQLDIWNMSVYGNFRDPNCTIPANADHVFYNYMGKSIIVLANPFEYFQRGTRSAFDLLDPHVVSFLASGGTQFLLPEAAAENQTWINIVLFPTRPLEGTPDARPGGTTKGGIVAAIRGEDTQTDHWISSKKKMFGKPQKTVTADAKSITELLNKNFPLRRFAMSPSLEGSDKKTAGKVFVRNGLATTARIVTGFGRWPIHHSRPSNLNVYLLVASLPFKRRARLFWDHVGGSLPSDEAKQFDFEKTPTANVTSQNPVLYQAICLSIMYELEVEISQFSANAPWPDVIPASECLKQLSKLDFLLSLAANPTRIGDTAASDLDLLVETLGTIVAGVVPIGCSQWMGQKMVRLGNRRTHLRNLVLAKTDAALKAVFEDALVKQLKPRITKESAAAKKALKSAGGTILRVVLSKVQAFTEESFSTLPFSDASLASPGSQAWGEADADTRVAAHMQMIARITGDEQYSEAMLREMVDS